VFDNLELLNKYWSYGILKHNKSEPHPQALREWRTSPNNPRAVAIPKHCKRHANFKTSQGFVSCELHWLLLAQPEKSFLTKDGMTGQPRVLLKLRMHIT
jgi:hypothetical protein